MRAAAGILLGALATGAALPVGNAQTAAPAAEPVVEAATAPAPDYGRTMGEYLRLMNALREGDETARERYLELGQIACRDFERCDALDVAQYYARMTRDELVAGKAADDEYKAIRDELKQARHDAMTGEEWDELRQRLFIELEEFVRDVLAEADFAPAGRALALMARLEVERIERDLRLTPAEEIDLYHRAESHASRAIDVLSQAGMVTPTLEPRWLLGRLELARRRPVQAREYFEELRDVALFVRWKPYQERALQGLVWLSQELGDADEVDRLLQQLTELSPPEKSWFTAKKAAESLLHRDEPEEAISLLLRAKPRSPEAVNQWNLLIGSARLRLDDLDGAREHFEALQGTPRKRAIALAQLDLRAGRPHAVLDRLDDDDLLERMPPNRRAQALAALAEAELALGDPAGAIEDLDHALGMADEWQARFESGRANQDPVINVIGEVIGLHAVVLLARAHAELGDGLEAARAIEDFQARSLTSGRGRARGAGAGLRDLRERRVERDEILAWARAYDHGMVTWAIGANSSVVAHVAPSGDATAWPIDLRRRQIRTAVRRLREAAIDGDERRLNTLATQVRDGLLPAELQTRLRDAATTDGRVLFLLHGPLEELPIEALVGTGALDRALVPVVLPGLTDDRPGRAADASDLTRWNLLGDPVMPSDASWSTLPGARAELGEIAALHAGAQLFAAESFDRDALETALASGRSLHLATHLVPGCDARSARLGGVGIYLSGGDVFCPTDIQAAAPTLPLVVLSACESQAGHSLDAEGLHGVARAFLESGTRNLLVTLWPVEDGAARAFATEFHRALLDGAAPSHAAAIARRELQSRGFAPADWSAFRALGRD